ncbi:hypothetical protein EON65_55515 [archaeon]|nr:MAG: hypothetical protein EON65_55515 [archaeon]
MQIYALCLVNAFPAPSLSALQVRTTLNELVVASVDFHSAALLSMLLSTPRLPPPGAVASCGTGA